MVSTSTATSRKGRLKAGPKSKRVKAEKLWIVRKILDEREGTGEYFVDWAGINPRTKEPWVPTWIPRANMVQASEVVQQWEARKIKLADKFRCTLKISPLKKRCQLVHPSSGVVKNITVPPSPPAVVKEVNIFDGASRQPDNNEQFSAQLFAENGAMMDYMTGFEPLHRSSSPSTWEDSSQLGPFEDSREEDGTDVHFDSGVDYQPPETLVTTPSDHTQLDLSITFQEALYRQSLFEKRDQTLHSDLDSILRAAQFPSIDHLQPPPDDYVPPVFTTFPVIWRFYRIADIHIHPFSEDCYNYPQILALELEDRQWAWTYLSQIVERLQKSARTFNWDDEPEGKSRLEEVVNTLQNTADVLRGQIQDGERQMRVLNSAVPEAVLPLSLSF